MIVVDDVDGTLVLSRQCVARDDEGRILTNVKVWDEQTMGLLDIEAVRAIYLPVYHFRVQQAQLAAHTPYLSSGVARTYYILTGCMEVRDDFSTYTLESGRYLSLPKGAYTLHHPDGVEYISVFELPEQVWAHEKTLYETRFRQNLQKIDHRLPQYHSGMGDPDHDS